MRARAAILLSLPCALLLSACEGGGSGTPIEVERQPVVVSITSPATGTTVGNYSAEVAFTASSDTAVRVAFASVNGGAEVGMDGQLAPFPRPFRLALAAGENRIRIRVTDATGRDATAEVVVTARPAQLSYDVVSLGSPDGRMADPADLNASGQVAGSARAADGSTRAFFWSAGQLHDLHPAGFARSLATGMNDAGEVVVNAHDAVPACGSAFLWKAGERTRIAECGSAADVNNQGVVLMNGVGSSPVAFWERGTVRTFPAQEGSPSPYMLSPSAINDRGEAVGQFANGGNYLHAGYWDGTRLRQLVTEARASGAFDITNDGLVLGAGTPAPNTGQPSRTVLWDVRAGTSRAFHPFGTLSTVVAINELGDLAGTVPYAAPAPRDRRGFVTRQGAEYEIVPTEAGWTITWIAEINDRGQIVGRAIPPGGTAEVGVIMTPRT